MTRRRRSLKALFLVGGIGACCIFQNSFLQYYKKSALQYYYRTLFFEAKTNDEDIVNNYFKGELGYPHLEILPLWDWEQASIQTENTTASSCQPPDGVPSYCCVGAVSSGGSTRWKAHECRDVPHESLLPWTKEYLQKSAALSGRPCDVCEILAMLQKHHWTVALQGDSVTSQSWSGLVCEIARRGFPIRLTTENIPASEANPPDRYQLTSIETLHVNLSSTITATLDDDDDDEIVTLRHYRAYRPGDYVWNRSLSENDVVVFDHGLHYPPNKAVWDFQKDMHRLLEVWSNRHEGKFKAKVVAWRETTAQHFDNPGGYFLRGYTPLIRRGCHPIPNKKENDTSSIPAAHSHTNSSNTTVAYPSDLVDFLAQPYPATTIREVGASANLTWRTVSDPDFWNTKTRNSDSEVYFFPYREYTEKLDGFHNSECTHYCTNPLLWQPIWRNLRLAMQRQQTRMIVNVVATK